jgi:HEAT repeat protein
MAPRTNEQWLERCGVQSTKEALFGALADPRPDVRSVVAQALAQRSQNDALPAIAAAFSAEKAPGTRMVMAYALALLGEKAALDELRSMCRSVSASAEFRLAAAHYLRELDDDGWLGGFVAALRSARTSPLSSEPRRDNALTAGLGGLAIVVPLDKVSGRQMEEIRALAEDCLFSGSRDLRMAASQALAKFGDAASAAKLEAAIAREQDQGVRARMEGDLEKLRATQH